MKMEQPIFFQPMPAQPASRLQRLGDAMRRYVRELTEQRAGWRWEAIRLKALERNPIAAIRMEALAGSDIAAWRDRRLKEVKPGTVAREMNLMRSVIEVARRGPLETMR